MKNLIIIPARLASTRLPNKPLADINGKPMIIHCIERGLEADIAPVLTATGDKEIYDVVKDYNYDVVLTKGEHNSGSNRIYEALINFDKNGIYQNIINLQGDLPTIEKSVIKDIVQPLSNPNIDIVTAATIIENDEDKKNPNIVKVIAGFTTNKKESQALYFTRAVAPYGVGDYYHHIGIYAYKRSALTRFVKLPASVLEIRERLEQLRALEDGMKIVVIKVNSNPLGVDTIEDLITARKMLKNISKNI